MKKPRYTYPFVCPTCGEEASPGRHVNSRNCLSLAFAKKMMDRGWVQLTCSAPKGARSAARERAVGDLLTLLRIPVEFSTRYDGRGGAEPRHKLAVYTPLWAAVVVALGYVAVRRTVRLSRAFEMDIGPLLTTVRDRPTLQAAIESLWLMRQDNREALEDVRELLQNEGV